MYNYFLHSRENVEKHPECKSPLKQYYQLCKYIGYNQAGPKSQITAIESCQHFDEQK